MAKNIVQIDVNTFRTEIDMNWNCIFNQLEGVFFAISSITNET